MGSCIAADAGTVLQIEAGAGMEKVLVIAPS